MVSLSLSRCKQDTVVALQALAKYSAATYNPEGSITVTVTSPSGQKNQFTVNQNNRLLYQEKQLQQTTGTYKLRAEGKGCVFVQVCEVCTVLEVQRIVHPERKNVITHSHVAPNMYDLLVWIIYGSHMGWHEDEYMT